MRPRQVVVCAVALAAAFAAVPADATPKPKQPRRCAHLISDQRGDVAAAVPGSLDIVSADVTISKTEIVGILRVAAAAGSPAETLGTQHALGVVVNGVRVEFAVDRATVTGAQRSSATYGGAAGSHTFGVTGTTYVWRLKRSALAAMARPKTMVTNAAARTSLGPLTADSASGTRSCPS